MNDHNTYLTQYLTNKIRSVSQQNITRKIFFLRIHTQNAVGKLVLDHFLQTKIEHIYGSTV